MKSRLEYRRVSWKYVVEFSGDKQVIVYPTRVKGHTAVIAARRGPIIARLSSNGYLEIWEGYGWDGPSGPAVDTESFMDASLVHDCLYQMIELGELPLSVRKLADQTMRDLAKEYGMGGFRRWYTFLAVRWFGKGHTKRKE